ncbi:HAMP domain-containing sensor histidine kinase [Actinomadura vinacea]|uniref:sensor histidine kinase n=1 Tax=Actinomadura vinacea TaxID=115336 RepID=UPI0031CE3D73
MTSIEEERRTQGWTIAEVAHDLRSPLAGLRAQLEQAWLAPGETPLRETLERALGDVDRLEAIITDVLARARLGDGNGTRENLDLAELVYAEVLRRSDRVSNELRLEPGVIVNACRVQLGRLLTNLLDNAQRHAAGSVEIEVRQDRDGAEVVVADDGAGIAEAEREKIFERHTRLTAGYELDGRGAGLGLTISREIAHAHSGMLDVGDSATGGARFVLRLPAV